MGVGGNTGSATALKPPLTLSASQLPLRLPVAEPERITDLFETVAATDRTSGSAPGEPTSKLFGPLLPAATATTTPCLAACSTARPATSSASPPPPSDRLRTSIPSMTACSTPAAISEEVPWGPLGAWASWSSTL